MHTITKSEISMKMIRVKDDTHEELAKIGGYGETMDDIIKRLIENWKKSH
jgi:predicted CopG family antitoxin